METKKNVRRRREERIRELRGHGPSSDRERFASSAYERDEADYGRWDPTSGNGGPIYPDDQVLIEPERLGASQTGSVHVAEERDPEEVWKMKEKELFARRPSGDSLYGGSRIVIPENEESSGYLIGAVRRFRIQLVLSAMLLAALWGLFHYPVSGSEPVKQVFRNMLDKEWDFAAVSVWYENRFGDLPSFLPAFHTDNSANTRQVGGKQKSFTRPLAGVVVTPFSNGHPWMEISAVPGSPVAAMDTGIVRFAGYRTDTGYTVVLRHSSGYETTYGYLTPGDMEKGNWVEAGGIIGSAGTNPTNGKGALYFALTKDKNVMDPAEVVRFD
ncbi:peptidoglycan DD-metalloendopeptidase family protein [Gorillibacterium massiliense]|uniref:peptidoglycan DD-metalloendopeptidase family protein n=1 Tax=Gorillibacterium massiliense TaxID=1280390 RepID=UPI0004B1D393|nr:peptidoglycan DD-metalloendopeptidase family protein [Gorillibacterium massiliense]